MSEIDDLLDRYTEEIELAWDNITPSRDSARAGREAESIRQKIVALHNAQAARIAELEAALREKTLVNLNHILKVLYGEVGE
jgi:hypothetical protein